MLGVHPCSYETWVHEVVLDEDDEYAYGDNLALYSSEYSYDTLGRRFGPFVAGSLPIGANVQQPGGNASRVVLNQAHMFSTHLQSHPG